MIKSQYNKLTNSKIFKDWFKDNKDYYLCHYVLINDIPQFDFYNPNTDKITSFIIKRKIEINKDQNIFKKQTEVLKELNLDEVKITLDDAYKLIYEQEEFKHETFNKKITILQNIGVPLWNISLISNCFNILNVKINAIDGSILSEKYESLLHFKAS